MISALGWIATGLFALSYLTKNPSQLRIVQALAAGLWILYGLGIHAAPVVVSNAVVATLALGSLYRGQRSLPGEPVS